MPKRGRPISRLTQVRLWIQRFALVLLILASLGLLAVGRVEAPWAGALRAGLMDALAPIAEGLSLPARAVGEWFGSVQDSGALRKENAALKSEIERLRYRLGELEQAERENADLRRLLGAPAPDAGRHVAARVIADPGGPYVRSVLIRAGSRDGVRRGQAVMTADGLVGRITEVGTITARVMLLSDLNSRTPVLIAASGERAVLAGTNADLPRLLHLPRAAQVEKGQRIVTSGHGGTLPAGLPIGEVVEVDGAIVRVRPYASFNALTYVRVLDHEMPGLLPAPNEPRPEKALPRKRNPVSAEGGSP